jgi:hypothetical protein
MFALNKSYKIVNQNSGKIVGVEGESHNTESGKNLIQWDWTNAADQEWLFFALDDGLYAIANQNSGKIVGVEGESHNTESGKNLIQWDWTNAPDQKWYFKSVADGVYKIVNQKSGKIVGVEGENHNTESGKNLIQWDWTNAPDQKWKFEELNTVTLPDSIKIESLSDIPRFEKRGQNLPDQTEKVITSYTLLPCIMVNDSWDIRQKIQNSPYYVLMKKEYWRKEFQEDLLAHESKDSEESWGMNVSNNQEMEEKTGITVTADAGFSFKGVSASISTSISHELKVSRSTKTEKMVSKKTTLKYENPGPDNISYAKYSRVIEYILHRTDGTPVSNPWSVVQQNDTRMTTWPQNANIISKPL